MATTTNLGITLLEQSQAQKEVTINQAFSVLDAFATKSVVDKDLTTPPSTPVAGALYIVAASATGAWTGKATYLSYFDQIWRFILPPTGTRVWVQDEATDYLFNGTAWGKASGTASIAAATSSLVVTNALCTTSSIVLAVLRTNDNTAVIKNVVPGAGSFTITLTASATATTSVGYLIIS